MEFGQIAITLAAIGAVGSCVDDGDKIVIDEPGPRTEIERSVDDFDRIEVAGPFRVTVSEGAPSALTISGPENLMEHLVFNTSGGELEIGIERGVKTDWRWTDDNAITINFSHDALRAAGIAGSGFIDIAKVSGDFEGEIAGSGDLRIREMTAGLAEFAIAGSGDIQAGGTAQRLDVSIAGSGDFMNPEFSAEIAEFSIAGSGDVEATVTETAEISIAGSGDVALTGGAQCTVSKAGSGNVVCS